MVRKVEAANPDLELEKRNVAEHEELARRMGVSSLPTLVFLGSDGAELSRMSGSLSRREIEAGLDAARAVLGTARA